MLRVLGRRDPWIESGGYMYLLEESLGRPLKAPWQGTCRSIYGRRWCLKLLDAQKTICSFYDMDDSV